MQNPSRFKSGGGHHIKKMLIYIKDFFLSKNFYLILFSFWLFKQVLYFYETLSIYKNLLYHGFTMASPWPYNGFTIAFAMVFQCFWRPEKVWKRETSRFLHFVNFHENPEKWKRGDELIFHWFSHFCGKWHPKRWACMNSQNGAPEIHLEQLL